MEGQDSRLFDHNLTVKVGSVCKNLTKCKVCTQSVQEVLLFPFMYNFKINSDFTVWQLALGGIGCINARIYIWRDLLLARSLFSSTQQGVCNCVYF